MTSDGFDEEIRQAYFDDCFQLIESAETLLILMDSGEVPAGAVDTLFRSAHNIKGSSMAMGFEELAHFAHVYEDVLSLLKKNTLQPTKEVLDLLFRTLDLIKTFIAGLKLDDKFKVDTKAVESELKSLFLQNNQNPGSPQSIQIAATPEPSVSPAPPPTNPAQTVAITPSPIAEKASAQNAPATAQEELIRVSTNRLDLLLNFIGELVINQSIMSRHKTEGTTATDQAIQTITYSEKLVNEIQDVAMSLRMTSVRGLFQKMHRTVRDIASSQSKEVNFMTEGEHVELDRTIIDRMGDPLTHLIRNAVDHGIEPTEARLAAQKTPRAKVVLRAKQLDDTVQIIIQDDGKGLDAKKLIAKGIEKGLVAAHQQLSDDEAYALIFKPGFSTKELVTDISGRGVGMDVVSRAVQEMKGSIKIATELGKGTAFIITLPLSLSIISGMVVGIASKKYVVPIAQLDETLDYRKYKIESSTNDGRMINLREEVIPVLSLGKVLGFASDKKTGQGSHGLVTNSDGRRFSFEVDELFGQQQIVIKKLGPKMDNLPGVIGGAILSNGEPSLVLNLHELTASTRRSHV